MAIIKNRVKTPNSFIEIIKFTLFVLKKFRTVFFLFLCIIILFFPIKMILESSMEIYGRLLSSVSFIADNLIDNIKTFYGRVSYLQKIEEQNFKLKLELYKINTLEQIVENLLYENRQLKELFRVSSNSREYDYITSKLIGVYVTPLSSFAIINAGKKNNIKVNDWVTNHQGLIGKIVNVSSNYSSVMLLNDPNSRVPVITSYSRESGILAKKSNEMSLLYLSQNHKVKVGELLYTSGDGKIYPYGILVGKISEIKKENILVKLAASICSTDFVVVQSIFDDKLGYLPFNANNGFNQFLEK